MPYISLERIPDSLKGRVVDQTLMTAYCALQIAKENKEDAHPRLDQVMAEKVIPLICQFTTMSPEYKFSTPQYNINEVFDAFRPAIYAEGNLGNELYVEISVRSSKDELDIG